MFHIPINLRIADCVEAPAAWAVLSIVAMQLYKDKIQRGLYNIGLKVYLFRKKKMSLNFQLLVKLCKFFRPQALAISQLIERKRVSKLNTTDCTCKSNSQTH